jgi:hypothetical protein
MDNHDSYDNHDAPQHDKDVASPETRCAESSLAVRPCRQRMQGRGFGVITPVLLLRELFLVPERQ